MKKYYILATVAILTGGVLLYMRNNSAQDTVSVANVNIPAPLNEPREQEEQTESEDVVGYYSNVGDYPEETALIPSDQLPKDIFPEQVTAIVEGEYAIVVKPSFNFALIYTRAWAEKNAIQKPFSGILQWNDTENRWEKLLQIEDMNPSISLENNPVSLRFEGAVANTNMRLVVADTNGAGSGEGIAKELAPANEGLSQWKVVDCYYYALDSGKIEDNYSVNINDSICTNSVSVQLQ